MLDQNTRNQAWLADLKSIITEMDTTSTARPPIRRRKARKPLWEA